VHAHLTPLQTGLTRDSAIRYMVMWGAVALVLLIGLRQHRRTDAGARCNS